MNLKYFLKYVEHLYSCHDELMDSANREIVKSKHSDIKRSRNDIC